MHRVSVVMPVYNGERFLAQAIESILAQTYKNFEFIIVCEYGTNNESLTIIYEYAKQDDRIVVLQNDIKRGLPTTLNIGVKAASGEYIVRMDGDDIALPSRLAMQVRFMDLNLDISIASNRVMYIDENGNELYQEDNLSENPEQIKSDFLFFCFIHHPTVIMRKMDIIDYDLFYDESFIGAEDYELWCRASHIIKFAKMPEALLKYRWHRKSTSHTNNNISDENCIMVMRVNLERLEISLSDDEIKCLCRTTCRENFTNYKKVEGIFNSLFDLIVKKNREIHLYDENCLIATLEKRIYWKRYKIRRFVVIFLKSVSSLVKKEVIFRSALYLELNGFKAVFKRIFF